MVAAAEAAGVVLPATTGGGHIKKRALRNKALAITFNDKDLKDYVGGFHKRKKKRRKEAQKQIEEKERRKRIEGRKKRKLDKEYAMNGGVPSTDAAEAGGEDLEQNDEIELKPSVSGTTTYESGDVMVTVTTCEIGNEEVDHPTEKSAPIPPVSTGEVSKKQNIPVSKKKTFKPGKKGKSRPKLQSKRDRRKTKIHGKRK